ncbi:hypothetical protein PoB_004591300 [Plakobranchus ocellatus]|uniref:DDE Tnp4 domain-containing protein n=1 Tax=Plakobranchus ocellatus TaxID=259542 RepID=A0AAV4BKR5_9GAST|nr:hypothetical protein PoB_004591300 [Plakobranchus ocellatus]
MARYFPQVQKPVFTGCVGVPLAVATREAYCRGSAGGHIRFSVLLISMTYFIASRMAKAEKLLYLAAACVELDELECAVVAVEAAKESVEPKNYKNRRFDLTQLSNTECCKYFRFHKADIIYRLQPWLSTENLNIFAQAVANKRPPLQNCWGFIDGTTMAISKPKQHQKVVLSGHKRIQCLKFQGIMVPNGLFAHMFGPMEGRRHDAAMFHEIITTMEETMMNRPDGTPLWLYGDPVYPLRRPHVMKPFMGARLTREQEEFKLTRTCKALG